jgi:16S rRNA (guanine527-N7)-methyltransferase
MSHNVGHSFTAEIYNQLSTYLDLLLRWNAKTNLTAIREPEQIVTRHFGESLFAAGVLFPDEGPAAGTTLADLGSGAGFPGLPIKLAFPALQVTLIESQNKKATFLKEAIRALRLAGIEVYSGRAEQWGRRADVVTLRAVEKFESILPVGVSLLAPGGRLCLLVGARQQDSLLNIPSLKVEVVKATPNRTDSLVVVGRSLH